MLTITATPTNGHSPTTYQTRRYQRQDSDDAGAGRDRAGHACPGGGVGRV